MRIKTNAVPELELTQENGLLVKKGNAFAITGDTFNLLTDAYKNVKNENGDKAVMKLGKDKNASTFLFAYDEDSKQNVLFVDGYLVTKISTNTKENKINVYTTNSNVAYKSFEEKDLITNKMAELDKAVKAENDVKAAKEEVIEYFNVKKVEEPILMQARLEVKTREDKIAAIKEEIETIKAQRAEKEAKLQPLLKDKKTTQNSKEVKNLNKEIDELKAKENAKEEAIIAINAELDGPIAVLNKKISNCKNDLAEENKKSDDKKDQKKVKALEKEIAKYEGEIVKLNQTKVISDLEKEIKTLEETRKVNDRKIVDANANLNVVQARASDRIEGKSVAANSNLKTAKEYRAEIVKLGKENAKIEEQISQLNAKIKEVQKQADKNLGYKEQLAKVEKEYDKNLEAVAPKSALAKTRIDEIEKANYDEAAAKPENVMKDTPVEMVGRIENAKYQAATESFEKEINDAAAEVSAKKEALRNDNSGNLYVRAQEVIEQPKYAQLYNYINGFTPVFWGTDVTLKGNPGYGCLVVGPKLNEDKKITGMSKDTLNRAMYLVVGKTINEVRKSLPETAEDFLNIEDATVYAADHISSKKDYSKAFAKVYKKTELLKDAEGNAVLDSNGRKQFVPSKNMTNISFDIRTDDEIAEFNKKEKEKAKKNGKKVEERVVDFTTPEMLEEISMKLGKKDCLDVEKSSYWKYNYTKSIAKKPIIVAAVILGAAALAAGVTYHFVNDNDKNAQISNIEDEIDEVNTKRNIAAAEANGAEQINDKDYKISVSYTHDGDAVVNYSTLDDTLNGLKHFKQDKLPEMANDVYVKGGAIKEVFKNLAIDLAEQGNITSFDNDYETLFKDYVEGYDFYTFTGDEDWCPTDNGYKNGEVMGNYYWDMGLAGYIEGAKIGAKTNQNTEGKSEIDPYNEQLILVAQDRVDQYNEEERDGEYEFVVEKVYPIGTKIYVTSTNDQKLVKLETEENNNGLEATLKNIPTSTVAGTYSNVDTVLGTNGVYVGDNLNQKRKADGIEYTPEFVEIVSSDEIKDYTGKTVKNKDKANASSNLPYTIALSYYGKKLEIKDGFGIVSGETKEATDDGKEL